jgi:hypothetical protein
MSTIEIYSDHLGWGRGMHDIRRTLRSGLRPCNDHRSYLLMEYRRSWLVMLHFAYAHLKLPRAPHVTRRLASDNGGSELPQFLFF